jgi:hypothetical protein
MPGALITTTPANTCSTPGCQMAVYKDSNGASGKYCTKSHKAYVRTIAFIDRRTTLTRRSAGWVIRAALRAGRLTSPAIPISARPVKFRSCRTLLRSSTLRKRTKRSRVVCFFLCYPLVPRPRPLTHRRTVAQQFKRSWRHTTQCPKVRAIYKIVPSQQNLDKYNTYRYVAALPFPRIDAKPSYVSNSRDSVEARGHFTSVNRPPGNENRRWHGTRRKCTLGDKGCTTFCSDLQCSLCCIVKTSFDLAHFGKKTSWGRFGPGIYTSSTSSKFASLFPLFHRSLLLMTIPGL